MATNETLMIAVPTEDVQVGDVDKWPSHITLVPWFDLETSQWEEFNADFNEEEIASDVDPIVVVGKKDEFTSQDGSPVSVARLFGIMIISAHHRAAGLVRSYGAEFDQNYTDENWHAHVTDKPYKAYEIGEEISLNSIAIFSKSHDTKRVKALYDRDRSGGMIS